MTLVTFYYAVNYIGEEKNIISFLICRLSR